jgi:hypothetical protein
MHTVPWNPDWVSHQVADLADEAGVDLNIKKLRHYTASQLLTARFDLQNTAARLGHGEGGATTLKHYADPVSEVDRRQAAYLAELTGVVTDDPGDVTGIRSRHINVVKWSNGLKARLASAGSRAADLRRNMLPLLRNDGLAAYSP